ncbi:hypothetical protein PV726_06750 [Streptomyces europaeiscabiei]|uniref:hypothetical protein n=1 Tax=Streptomyces europaeiscabiei TaxID=146819 RepID=UPI0029B90097|nr:hypothetical protein [Streptomyces europaeiscabiei]MDX3690042.1 hypothetical protein [Streptomyces europaeiscabiei]
MPLASLAAAGGRGPTFADDCENYAAGDARETVITNGAADPTPRNPSATISTSHTAGPTRWAHGEP